MKTRLLIAIALISLGLVSCMKKTRIGSLNIGNGAEVLPDYGNPATPSTECPNGVSLTLTPPSNANYRVNETSTFNVTASGCKYGYRLSYDNENRNFGDSTTVLAAASFPKTFTTAGPAVVSARVSVLNQNQQPVREFPISISVIVNEALPLECPSANIMIPQSVSGDYHYAFTLQPSRPAIITGITGSAPDFISASPTLSTTPSQSIQGNIVVKGRNGTLSFAIKDANNVTATCSVQIRKDIYGVTLDFNGDGILDDAALVRLSDGSYQLQISYTQFAGATKVTSIIPATGFLSAEFYEWMIAGDLNGDSRPELIFFRREGNPGVGKFKIARSRGGSVGGTDLAYDFSDLPGQWANDRLLQFPWLDVGPSPARIVGKIGNQFYTSRIENNTVANPEPLTYSLSLTASPTTVTSGGSSTITLNSQGYRYCSVFSCAPVDSNNRCNGLVSTLGAENIYYQSRLSNYVLRPNTKSLVAARCDLGGPLVGYQEVLIQVSAPPTPPLPPAPPLPAHCLAGEVSGGEVVDQGPYRIHKFKNVGVTPLTLTRNCAVDLLVVGGGGGGGVGRASGGGGAGGVVYQSGYRFSAAGTYSVTVGAGGAANANGGNSSVNSLVVAVGGGKGGGGEGRSNQGGTGGSGGGAGFKNNCSVGAGTSGQGNAGGCARNGNWIAGGGGGGAAGVGTAGGCSGASVGTVCGGNGGAGVSYDISGASATYAGGGGGNGQGVAGAGGAGGGGRGGVNGGAGASGVANTGGGGGASSGAGGSGVVILRYFRSVVR